MNGIGGIQLKTTGLVFDGAHQPALAEPSATTLTDYSPYGNDGTFQASGHPDWVQESSGLWVMDFAGDPDYVNMGTAFQSAFRGSFTLICWVKPDDGIPASTEAAMGCSDGSNNYVLFRCGRTDGKLSLLYNSNGNEAFSIAASASFSDGQETWHQVVAIGDSTVGGANGLKLYFDASAVTLAASPYDGNTSGTTFSEWTSTDIFFTGAYNNDGSTEEFFNGLLALPRIYNYVLSSAAITKLYTAERAWFGV